MSDVRVDFKSDSSQIDKSVTKVKNGLSNISTAAKGFGVTLKSAFAPLFLIGAALGGITAVVGGFKDVIDLGGDLDDLSTSTGISVDQLLVLGNAFELAGLSSDLLSKAVLGLNNKLEAPTPKIIDTLNQLGLNFKNIQGLPIDRKFSIVSKAIGSLSSETDRAVASSALFGGALGRDLLPLFAGGASAINDATKNVGGLAGTMSKYAPAFAKIGDALDSVIVKTRQFFAAFLGENADKLVRVADIIMGMDLTKAGKQLGDAFNSALNVVITIIRAIQQGKLGEAFSNALELGWLNLKPILEQGLASAAYVFANVLVNVLTSALNVFADTELSKKLVEMAEAARNTAYTKAVYSDMGSEDALRRSELRGYFGKGAFIPENFDKDTGSSKVIKKLIDKLSLSKLSGDQQGIIEGAKAKIMKPSELPELGGPVPLSDLQRVGGAKIFSGVGGPNPMVEEQKKTNKTLQDIYKLQIKEQTENKLKGMIASFA